MVYETIYTVVTYVCICITLRSYGKYIYKFKKGASPRTDLPLEGESAACFPSVFAASAKEKKICGTRNSPCGTIIIRHEKRR